MSSDAMTDRPVGRASARAGDEWRRVVASDDPATPTLVIGLGNPILGDDGVGWRVVDELESRLGDAAHAGTVELDRMSVGGLTLMERLVDCQRAIVVDAIIGPDRLGTIRTLPLKIAAQRRGSHLDSAHDATLVEAIDAGRALGARLPDDITVVGIAVRRVDEFDEHLSPPIARAVDRAAETVVRLLADRPDRTG